MRELDRRSFLTAVGGAAGAGLLGRTFLVRGEVTEVRSTRLMMGSLVTVTAVTRNPDRAELGVERAFETMSRLESVFTRHDPDGEVARLNEAGVLADPSPELVALLRQCRTLYDRTDGAFDPTVLPVLSAFESGRDRPRDARRRVADATFDSVAVSESELRAPTPITLDGVAKGAVVDAGVAALRDWVDAGLVEAGATCGLSAGPTAAGASASRTPARTASPRPSVSGSAASPPPATTGSTTTRTEPVTTSSPRGPAGRRRRTRASPSSRPTRRRPTPTPPPPS
jgi:thiamine biosynthesis lipoprotein